MSESVVLESFQADIGAPAALEGANGRLKRRARRSASISTSPVVQQQVAALASAGIGRQRIAQSLNLSYAVVRTVLDRPDVQQMAGDFRQAMRLQALSGAQQLQARAWKQARRAVKDNDAQAFQRWTNGLLNAEKVGQGAAGEGGSKIQIATIITNPGSVSEEARALVLALQDGSPNG